jgi:PDDEXK-like uncharacterized protein DUF3799
LDFANAPTLTEPEILAAYSDGRLGRTLCVVRTSNAAYHQGPGVSSTDLKALLRSPEHYAASKLKTWKETPALRFGRRCHEALFEPTVFGERYVVEPQALADQNKTKNPWKAEWDKLKETTKAEGKEIIEFYDAEDIAGICYKVTNHTIWQKQIAPNNPIFELAFYYWDEALGVLLKAKLDIIVWSMGLILDLKTTEDARNFSRVVEAHDRLYHLSAAFYIRVVAGATQCDPKAFNFVWIPAEKEAPYGTKFCPATPLTLQAGNVLVDRALAPYAKSMKEQKWPGYAETWEEIELSPYHLRSLGL